MVVNTKAFIRLKSQQSLLMNFAVLVCSSVPALKKSIKGLEENVANYERLPTADYFKGTKVSLLKEYVKYYKLNLSKHLILSAFSFYEAYKKSAIEELIEFHGGKENFLLLTERKAKATLDIDNDDIKKSRKKLNEYPKKGKNQKYSKHVKILEKRHDFRFPGELFASYGIKYFIEFTQGGNFTASAIPDVLEYAFHFDLMGKVNVHSDLKDKTLRETVEYLRTLRNQIAHGDNVSIGFEKCMDLIRFFRKLTSTFDKHLVANYFILEQ